jgi:hypothetical protein
MVQGSSLFFGLSLDFPASHRLFGGAVKVINGYDDGILYNQY